MLPQMLSGMFSGSDDEGITPPETTPSGEATPVEGNDVVGSQENQLTPQEKKDKVVKCIQAKIPRFEANSPYLDKLVANYDVYKDVYKLSDDDMTTRLCAYYNALISHDVQQTYGVRKRCRTVVHL